MDVRAWAGNKRYLFGKTTMQVMPKKRPWT